MDVHQKTPLSLEDMREDISRILNLPPHSVRNHDDLVGLGLDSMGVMKLAGLWRRRGTVVKFTELMKWRTLADWWEFISGRDGATPSVLTNPSLASPSIVDDGTAFELATMQHAYWIGRAHGQELASSCHYYFEFDGKGVDPQRLASATQAVLRRHPMLRARFLEDGQQQILPSSPWIALTLRDLTSVSSKAVEEHLATVRSEQANRRLEVERGEGFDVQLSLLPEGRTRLHLNIDMLVADAMSFRILIDELAQLYADPSRELPEIGYSYRQYLADSTSARRREREQSRSYWSEKMRELPGGPKLPLAIDPRMVNVPRIIRREHRLKAEEWSRLNRGAQLNGLTLPLVLATAFAEVLNFWSAEPQFVLNVPLFDRQPLHPDIDKVVGDFTSSILLICDMRGSQAFAQRARRLQEILRADAAHADYAGVDVLRDLSRVDPEIGASAGTVVFTSALGMGDLFGAEAPKQFGKLAWMVSQTAQVWLDHQVTEVDGELLLNWDAVENLFPTGMLDAMFEAYLHLLHWLSAESSDWEVAAPLLPQSDLSSANCALPIRLGQTGCLHDGLFRHAKRDPSSLALAWGNSGSLDYGTLAERVLRIAASLASRGVAPGDAVAITLPKGPGQVEAVLGVLAAGAVYVPVGTDQPALRRIRLYARADVRLVLTDAFTRSSLEWSDDLALLTLEEARLSSPASGPVELTESARAYVIYTSGTTGEPRGVQVTHGNAMNTIEDVIRRFELNSADRVLSVSPLEFDWTVADIFQTLTVGGTIVTIDDDARRDARVWEELMSRWGVTIWQSVPALLEMLLVTTAGRLLPSSLRLVMLGGDWIGLDLYERLKRQAPQCRLIALGGTTETAIHCTVQEVTEVPSHWRSIPYGYPLSNVVCRVVDPQGRDRPDWVPGELWIGGAGVALGYIGDPKATAARFVTAGGRRWFRSGDDARYWPDGTLEFLGRRDSQIKLLGQRIELGEVETAIREHPGVQSAMAIVLEGPSRRLGAAVIPSNSGLQEKELREFCAARLPPSLIPFRIAVLSAFPLTFNGKVDLSALGKLVREYTIAATDDNSPPSGDIELIVAKIWMELLGVPAVGRGQSFFALGGDSLLATRMVRRICEAGLSGARMRRLITSPTLREFAATIGLTTEGNAAATCPARSCPADPFRRYEPFPLTDVQRAYWLGRTAGMTLGGVGSHWYWEFDGRNVDLPKLERVINCLIERHEMLRAIVDDKGTQRILQCVPHFEIAVETSTPEQEEASVERMREFMTSRSTALSIWPLFQIRALVCDERTRIGFSFDYIVLDALSITIIFREMSILYSDEKANLPAVKASYRDYVIGLVPDYSKQATADAYWASRVATLPGPPRVPFLVEPECLARPRFTRREAKLSVNEWRSITNRARRYDLTPAAVLAASYAEVLSFWTSEAAFSLVVTLFDRRDIHEDISAVVGDFTSLLLVPYQPAMGSIWLDRVRGFQRELWEGIDHREVSAIELLRKRMGGNIAGGEALAVFTSTLGLGNPLMELSTSFGSYAGGLSQTPQVWLDNQVMEYRGELLVHWDAVEELLPPGMLDVMFAAYHDFLRCLSADDVDWGTLLPQPPALERPSAIAAVRPKPMACLHDGLFSHAQRDPRKLALAWGDSSFLDYGTLAEHALRVAGHLASRGVNPGELVAVRLPKGPEQVIGVLGCLASGCSYLPIGVDQPTSRCNKILSSAGCSLVLDNLSQALAAEPLSSPISGNHDASAYVIFTSGSTGNPKGVEVCHKAAMNTIEEINDRFDVGACDRVLAVSAPDFDLSVYDVFGSLNAGAAAVLIQEEERREAHIWARRIQQWGVTIWNSVPALLELLLAAVGERRDELGLRLAFVSGDWIPLNLPALLLRAAPECRFIAMGGATEASIWSNAFEVDEIPAGWSSIPYGYPLANQKFRVVSKMGMDCPDWVPGELWIGGAGLASGYRNDPAQTAERFVQHAGERWFRTGDHGRYWPDGTLEFLGRIDGQVKIRGQRVELGEVEAAIRLHPAVAQAIALPAHPSRQALWACFVPLPGKCVAPETLRVFLQSQLPSTMVPERIIAISEMPLNQSGKVDRQALTMALMSCISERSHDPPRGPTETAVAEVWAEVLSSHDLSREQDFFAAGGDSLRATRLLELFRRRFGVELGMRQLIQFPTIASLAEIVTDRLAEAGEMDEAVL